MERWRTMELSRSKSRITNSLKIENRMESNQISEQNLGLVLPFVIDIMLFYFTHIHMLLFMVVFACSGKSTMPVF